MNILLSCLQDLRLHDIPSYGFWRTYFVHGLTEAGHQILEVPDVDWAQGCTTLTREGRAEWLTETWTRTVEFTERSLNSHQPVQLFLSYLYPEQVDTTAISAIRRLGVPCVNFFCDNVREFRRVPPVYACFDLHWVPEFEALEMYKQARAKFVHAPMPVWIPPNFRTPVETETGLATFIGSHDALRHELLSRAIEAGGRPSIRGPGWQATSLMPLTEKEVVRPDRWKRRSVARIVNQINFLRSRGLTQWLVKMRGLVLPIALKPIPGEMLGAPVWGEEYFRLSRESTVTIGINRVPNFQRLSRRPLTYSRLRDIEAPMLGACYLTEWTEGLDQLYNLGEEVETYRAAEEMVEKIDRLTADADRRRSLRIAGQRRALTDHTIGNSVRKIGIAVGIK